MTTLQNFITQAKTANPKPQYKTINDEKIKLNDEEYEISIEALATMQLEQEKNEIEIEVKKQNLQAVLDKLGLTENEVAALLD